MTLARGSHAPLHPGRQSRATKGAASAVALALLVACATGCSSAASPSGSTSEAISLAQGTWQTIGYGIRGTIIGSGNNVLVTYGGYTARDQDSRAWALALNGTTCELRRAGDRIDLRGAWTGGRLICTAREIGNSELAAQLSTQAGQSDFIIVIAHSSGAFVADELFTEASNYVLSKIVYFDLDGGSVGADQCSHREDEGGLFRLREGRE